MADLVDVVEAAYRFDLESEPWLKGVCEAARPRLDRGLGVYGFHFDASHPERFEPDRFAITSDTVIDPKLVKLWHSTLQPEEISRIYRSPRAVAPISWRMGQRDHPAMQLFCHGLGVADQLTVRVVDPTLHGLTICSPTADTTEPTRAENHAWTLVATHVVAAYRIRRALEAHPVTDGADAVLTPDGRTAHAEGDARSEAAQEQLRRAALAADRARSRNGRGDEMAALELWQGLVAGTWSLVDHFDSDGRRFLVARRNAPDAPDPRALTPRERQIAGFAALGMMNKEIAHSLGLAESTISTALASLCRKLGVRGRVELIRHLQPYVTEEQLE